MKIQTKHIITGLIGLVTVSGAIAYWQYKKAMDYTFKVSLSRVKSLTTSLISLDLIIKLFNKSSIAMRIKSNESKIYVNNNYITKITNNKPFNVAAGSESDIPINVEFKPSDVIKAAKLSVTDIFLNPEKINIRIDTTLKAKFWKFTVNINDSTILNLKEMQEENKLAKNNK